jgi:hypothetical protein
MVYNVLASGKRSMFFLLEVLLDAYTEVVLYSAVNQSSNLPCRLCGLVMLL